MNNFEAYEPVLRWVAYQEFGFHRMAGLPLAASKYKTGSCRQGLLLSKNPALDRICILACFINRTLLVNVNLEAAFLTRSG